MFWRAAFTTIVWVLGFGFVLSDGQTLRNAITILVAAVIGSMPWIRLAFRKSGTRGRVTAILIVSLSAIVVAWIASDLPQAYEFQRRFNEGSIGR